jgi:hypothetical protein
MTIDESTPSLPNDVDAVSSLPNDVDAVVSPVAYVTPVESSTGQGPSPIRQRLLSLDAIAGFDMFWIVVGDSSFGRS